MQTDTLAFCELRL